jgi:hypothetical protein
MYRKACGAGADDRQRPATGLAQRTCISSPAGCHFGDLLSALRVAAFIRSGRDPIVWLFGRRCSGSFADRRSTHLVQAGLSLSRCRVCLGLWLRDPRFVCRGSPGIASAGPLQRPKTAGGSPEKINAREFPGNGRSPSATQAPGIPRSARARSRPREYSGSAEMRLDSPDSDHGLH